jgi:hypothetical protein
MQLSQSEPSLVPDLYPSDSVPLQFSRPGPGPSSSTGKDRRRNTLHVDISISKLGHMRAVSDDDPVLTLGDSSLDTQKADDKDHRARRQRRRGGDKITREKSTEILDNTEVERKRQESLHTPLRTSLLSSSPVL